MKRKWKFRNIQVDSCIDQEIVLGIYNSNVEFLRKHLGVETVSLDFITSELQEMKEIGFNTLLIEEPQSGKVVAYMDIKEGRETYLSLLMIDMKFQGKGFGRSIVEAYLHSLKKKGYESVRIDVVIDQGRDEVYDFWSSLGFYEVEEVQLDWNGKVLQAVMMKRNLTDIT